MSMSLGVETFGEKHFQTNMPTWQFVLLVIGTLGLWYFFWLIRYSETLNRLSGKVIIHIGLPICMLALSAWRDICISSSDQSIQGIGLIFSLASIVIVFLISLMSKNALENVLQKHGMPYKLNGFLCFIAAGYYQYYVIRNAEILFSKQESMLKAASSVSQAVKQESNDAKYRQLEQLTQLKQSGSITEEEFLLEKKKLLSDS